MVDDVDVGDGKGGVKCDSRGLLVEEIVYYLDLYVRDGLRMLCMVRRVSYIKDGFVC